MADRPGRAGLIRAASLTIALAAGIPALAYGQTSALPLGDGKLSSATSKGYVYACQSRFNGGGTSGAGPWIRGNQWYPGEKPTVDGSIAWPNSRVAVSVEGGDRVIRANNLPAHPTGRFPIQATDDAYRYDRNPNSIRDQNILLRLPAVPQVAARESCVPMGMIGFALTGAAIFNALDARGRDAPAHEVQDRCNGHPERHGQYHYHNYSPCMSDHGGEAGKHSELVGYMLDGFGIYGPRGEDGKVLTSADLDACHGHSHKVEWDGQERVIYHYHFTADYPYTIGCFRGTPVHLHVAGRPQGASPPDMPGGPRGRLAKAARELDITVEELRRALGPPPPDFEHAARALGISEDRIRRAMGGPP